MSGFELTKKIKNSSQYQDIPIIMFSALDDVQDKLTGFDLGIDDYITKPFNFTEVLARIKTALRNHELVSQIIIRDSRLNLAETLSHDIKQTLSGLIRHIDDFDSAVALIPENETDDLRKKTQKIRMSVAETDARIDKTLLEWEALKKNEIGLSVLESQVRKFFPQE
jgi:DNA-binding response OmpR family regulator